MHCAITTLETRRREPQTGSHLLTLIQYGTKAQRLSLLVIAKITVYLDCLTMRPGGPKNFTITTPTERLVIFLAFDLEAVTLLL